MSHYEQYQNPDSPPMFDSHYFYKNHGDRVWSSIEQPDREQTRDLLHRIWVWHWCTHELWPDRDPSKLAPGHEDFYDPRWVMTGVGHHTLVSADPMHLEPSLYWNRCCGLHGFLRQGIWTSV